MTAPREASPVHVASPSSELSSIKSRASNRATAKSSKTYMNVELDSPSERSEKPRAKAKSPLSFASSPSYHEDESIDESIHSASSTERW